MQKKELLQLIRKAKAKDPDAFSSLIYFYMKDLYRVAISILMNDEDAADAIQDTILGCWEKLHTLKEEKYFKTWITRILINRCYDIRKKQQRITAMEKFEEPSAEDQYNVELKEALGQLDEKYRIVMVLYYSEGYQTGEIAELLEIPEVVLKKTDDVLAQIRANAKPVKKTKKVTRVPGGFRYAQAAAIACAVLVGAGGITVTAAVVHHLWSRGMQGNIQATEEQQKDLAEQGLVTQFDQSAPQEEEPDLSSMEVTSEGITVKPMELLLKVMILQNISRQRTEHWNM